MERNRCCVDEHIQLRGGCFEECLGVFFCLFLLDMEWNLWPKVCKGVHFSVQRSLEQARMRLLGEKNRY